MMIKVGYILSCIYCIFHLNKLAYGISATDLKTHYRILIENDNNLISLEKKENTVELKSLQIEFLQEIYSSLMNYSWDKKYISKIQKINDNSIQMELADKNLEVFTYYHEGIKKTIIDLWKKSSNNVKKSIVKKEEKKIPDPPKEKIEKIEVIGQKVENKVTQRPIEVKKVELEYRDFRYGAPLIWNYDAYLPQIQPLITLSSKTPEFFYPIENVEYKKDEKTAHMQISINLYKKGNFGLMSKSIKLYKGRYGEHTDEDINDYLMANSLLRSKIGKLQSSEYQTAYILLSNILERAKNYELQRAIIKFLIQYTYETQDYIQTLKYSEQFYLLSKENFDQESMAACIEIMMHNLAKLAQIERLEKFINEKAIRPYIIEQIKYAYLSYIYLIKDKTTLLSQMYENKMVKLAKPIHPAILFNVAENYFRNSQFDDALKVFDQYLEFYSHELYASYSRNRLALIFEITNKDYNKTLRLYEEAINKSTNPKTTYEAKIRYVAMRNARKVRPDAQDEEAIVFLENTNYERLGIDKNIKKILWLTRMRTLLNVGKFQEAFSYLDTIPLYSLTPGEKRIFESDGSEIIYGLMRDKYRQKKYAENVKLWEQYRNVFFDKLTNNPKINYFVAHSYLDLGLVESFERNLAFFEKIEYTQKRLYPLWVEDEDLPIDELILELKILRFINAKNISKAQEFIDEFVKKYPEHGRGQYFDIKLSYLKNDYKICQEKFEKYMLGISKWDKVRDFESVDLSTIYLESLYYNQDYDRMVQLGIESIQAMSDEKWIKEKERILYLIIESLNDSDKQGNVDLALNEINNFRKLYPKSKWKTRIDFLEGVSLKKNNELEKSKKLFEKIYRGVEYNAVLKNLAKAELTELQFKKYKL